MSNDWIDDEGFRANVGIILVNAENKLLLGGRVGAKGWQFPQGGIFEGEDPEQAMYRELREEVGLEPETVRLLGKLTPLHVPVSHFVLHPRVGIVQDRPDLRPDLREVSRILRVPLDQLLDPPGEAVDASGDQQRLGGNFRRKRIPFQSPQR